MKAVKTILTSLAALSGVLFTNVSLQAADFKAGEDYVVTAPKGSDEPMVEEFFNYACGACYSMEKFVSELKSGNPDVKFKAVPVELNPAWKIYVKAYYVGEKLGLLETSHPKLFHRIHVERKPLKNDDDMKAFFVSLGADAKAFDDIIKSYWLNTQLRQAKQYAFKHKIGGTPVFLVNQKYKLNNKNLGTYARIQEAVQTLSGANDLKAVKETAQ